MKHSVSVVSITLGASMFFSTSVSAAPVFLEVCSGSSCWTMSDQIQDGVVANWSSIESMANSGGNTVNQWGANNGLTVTDWTLSMDSDPFVTNNFTFTNNSGALQTFSLTTTLGVTPAIPNGLMRGTFGVTVTDNDGNTATLESSGVSIYQGLIDNNVARTLADPLINFIAPAGRSTTADFAFGTPTRELAPESVDTDIGVTITFSLTPNDSAAITSNFDVVVPIPASVWLFGSGLLGLVGIARRRCS